MSSTHFPAVGHIYEADFGSWNHHLRFEFLRQFRLCVHAHSSRHFYGQLAGRDETTVVHVEDYEKGIVHTNVTKPRGAFIRYSGTLKKVE